MQIEFKTKELYLCSIERKYAIRKLGKRRAELFLQRLNMLYNAASFEDLRNTAGHFHELKYDRKGQWSFDLDQPYRLIVTPITIPTDAYSEAGGFTWSALRDAIVVEIVNYHKEG